MFSSPPPAAGGNGEVPDPAGGLVKVVPSEKPGESRAPVLLAQSPEAHPLEGAGAGTTVVVGGETRTGRIDDRLWLQPAFEATIKAGTIRAAGTNRRKANANRESGVITHLQE